MPIGILFAIGAHSIEALKVMITDKYETMNPVCSTRICFCSVFGLLQKCHKFMFVHIFQLPVSLTIFGLWVRHFAMFLLAYCSPLNRICGVAVKKLEKKFDIFIVMKSVNETLIGRHFEIIHLIIISEWKAKKILIRPMFVSIIDWSAKSKSYQSLKPK